MIEEEELAEWLEQNPLDWGGANLTVRLRRLIVSHQTLKRERDEARHVASCLWEFLQEWDGLSDVRFENAGFAPDTPEFDLHLKAVVAEEVGRETAWLKGDEVPDLAPKLPETEPALDS